MGYGFCFTKYKKNGTMYKHCPGYLERKSSSTPLEKKLLDAKFVKKVIKQVAAKMKVSRRPMSDYSKTTGKLKSTR